MEEENDQTWYKKSPPKRLPVENQQTLMTKHHYGRKKNYYQDLYKGCYIHTKNYILKYHYIHYYSNKYPIIIQIIY